MFFNHSDTLDNIQKLVDLVANAKHTYAITGAGISTNAGIPDLRHLASSDSGSLSSESYLEANPTEFYNDFHRLFIDPIFHNGPTKSHYALAELEKQGKLAGVITTNVDYLHELAGSQQVADIWRSLNVNHCLTCGRIYDIKILNQSVPRCPECGGLISPDPVYHHIGIDENAYAKANSWMAVADLVIVIGSNGYYGNVLPGVTVVNINNRRNDFDARADLIIRSDSDAAITTLIENLN
ncbi:hypothetical protein LTY36_03370 [Limosilactobacillus agrestis]|uniref:protein acetyllysine N-acetyltransferase n=1 Tax=Limosilactobacillus agrestis TaxID=2759748 RepID=A0ABS8RC58_9LACO|nr:Sir2 family NAD-dependent protein deacetylase [Limosilactobacillus agrestis]MBD5090879.1 hypothetical protein [Lactobacillus sp.]MCD7130244.1 hypothetical protein [Limosilactobacillus agrestis]